MVTATFHPKAENQPFEDVIAEVKKSLREQITKEHLEEIFSYNVTGEKTMILRTIPLVFKKIRLQYGGECQYRNHHKPWNYSGCTGI